MCTQPDGDTCRSCLLQRPAEPVPHGEHGMGAGPRPRAQRRRADRYVRLRFLQRRARPAGLCRRAADDRTGEDMPAKIEHLTYDDRPDAWVSTTKHPLHDDEGHIVGTFGISCDVTAQVLAERHLAESEERFRSIFDQAPLGILRLDAQGRIVDANRPLRDRRAAPRRARRQPAGRPFRRRRGRALAGRGTGRRGTCRPGRGRARR